MTLAASQEEAQRVITAAELLAGVTDVDSPAGSRSITSLTIAQGGGSLVNNGDGAWTYTPAANDDTGDVQLHGLGRDAEPSLDGIARPRAGQRRAGGAPCDAGCLARRTRSA